MDYSEVYEVMKKELKATISSFEVDEKDVHYNIEEYTDAAGNVNISLFVKCNFASTEDKMFHVTLMDKLKTHYLAMGNVSKDNPLEFSITVSLPNGQIPKG